MLSGAPGRFVQHGRLLHSQHTYDVGQFKVEDHMLDEQRPKLNYLQLSLARQVHPSWQYGTLLVSELVPRRKLTYRIPLLSLLMCCYPQRTADHIKLLSARPCLNVAHGKVYRSKVEHERPMNLRTPSCNVHHLSFVQANPNDEAVQFNIHCGTPFDHFIKLRFTDLLDAGPTEGCHPDCCVAMCNEKALNPLQTWLPGFSAMYHYTKLGMASSPRHALRVHAC